LCVFSPDIVIFNNLLSIVFEAKKGATPVLVNSRSLRLHFFCANIAKTRKAVRVLLVFSILVLPIYLHVPCFLSSSFQAFMGGHPLLAVFSGPARLKRTIL
jgi:hypothetical protein